MSDVQRAVLFKLNQGDVATVTELHQWYFHHLTRARIRSAINQLVKDGLARTAGIGDRNAPTYTITDAGRAIFARTGAGPAPNPR